jgi:hypothetical protein
LLMRLAPDSPPSAFGTFPRCAEEGNAKRRTLGKRRTLAKCDLAKRRNLAKPRTLAQRRNLAKRRTLAQRRDLAKRRDLTKTRALAKPSKLEGFEIAALGCSFPCAAGEGAEGGWGRLLLQHQVAMRTGIEHYCERHE